MRSLRLSKFAEFAGAVFTGAVLALSLAAPLHAQRGGQYPTDDSDQRKKVTDVAKPKKKPSAQPPRAVAVLEWTPEPPNAPSAPKLVISDKTAVADLAKKVLSATVSAPSKDTPPKQARLIPVSIFYQGQYQDAGVFLSQPTPLALQADTVYALEKSGDPAGTFALHAASRLQDEWIGTGDFKPVPPPKPFKPNVNIALGSDTEEEGDRPVLRRRQPESTSTTTTPSSGTTTAAKPASSGSDSNPVGSEDPDRPTLKRHDTTAAQTPSASPSGADAPTGSDDPDRPTLHRAPAASQTSSPPTASNGSPATVADPKTTDNYLNPADDPLRPHIKRGVYNERNPALPSLLSSLGDVRQTVAVSDAARIDDHTFVHAWNDDAERARAQQAMQQLALSEIAKWRKNLPAPTTPPPPPGKTARATKAPAKSNAAPDLTDVQFAAYDLAYQDEPTYIFAAQSRDTGLAQLFVAVIARPDIYGNLQVAFSAVTNGAELALTPRYRLVDAVDANGDGRAELLLESRNLDGRRFVLLDVYRGEATKVFETGLLP